MSVCSAEEAMLSLHLGFRHRHMAATKLNYEYSQGHAIFSIKLVKMVSFAEKPTNAIISRLVIRSLGVVVCIDRSNNEGRKGGSSLLDYKVVVEV